MTGDITLRDVVETDLPIFFHYQQDPIASYMVAFTARDPNDQEAFMAHWAKIMADESNMLKTILVDQQVAGNIVSYLMFGERHVGYWLGRDFWGRGIASQALRAFIALDPVRPLYGRAVVDNFASIRVMQKCGFTICGGGHGFSYARGATVEEVILVLQ